MGGTVSNSIWGGTRHFFLLTLYILKYWGGACASLPSPPPPPPPYSVIPVYKVAPAFQKQYDVSLSEGLIQVRDLNLQQKTKNTGERTDGNHYSQVKNIENQMNETAFDR